MKHDVSSKISPLQRSSSMFVKQRDALGAKLASARSDHSPSNVKTDDITQQLKTSNEHVDEAARKLKQVEEERRTIQKQIDAAYALRRKLRTDHSKALADFYARKAAEACPFEHNEIAPEGVLPFKITGPIHSQFLVYEPGSSLDGEIYLYKINVYVKSGCVFEIDPPAVIAKFPIGIHEHENEQGHLRIENVKDQWERGGTASWATGQLVTRLGENMLRFKFMVNGDGESSDENSIGD